MSKIFLKIIFMFLGLIIAINPILILPEYAYTEAADASLNSDNSGENVDFPDQLQYEGSVNEYPDIKLPDSFISASNSWNSANDPDTNPLSLEDIVSGVGQPKLVLNGNDSADLRALSCLDNLMPDYASDTKKLFSALPSGNRPKNEADLSALKISSPDKFYGYVKKAQDTWHNNNQELILNDSATLSCISGLTTNEVADLRTSDPDKLKTIVADSKDALTIDTRVLKTLVYLVTPKNKGGAGHYRVKVDRIRTGYTSESRQYSRESDAILSQKSQSNSTVKASSNDISGKTAAEIGMSQIASNASPAILDGQTISATVEDQNGDTYDAYISNQMANEDAVLSGGQDDRNVSAHTEGKAIDVSEIDDIRCTLVKHRRLGSDSVSKYTQRPIKLAWQTQQGYADSGGNDVLSELGNLFKQQASQGIQQLIEELGGDISNYNGDLSGGNVSDIVQIVGKSLFSQIINSPNGNLSGYNFQDTLQKIGGMYFADFVGLPSEIFTSGQVVNYFDDLQRVIGQAAVEKRLDLPYGTFTGKTLPDVLLNIGQRKIEYEMNLDPGALAGIHGDIKQNIPLLIGQAVIEKNLALQKGSFAGKNYGELKNNLGKYKGTAVFLNPSYTDSILHLNPGTTEKLKSGALSPIAYATEVGQIRLDDTAYGFKYLASHDSAYNLPSETWDNALLGDTNALGTIGSDTIAKAFAVDNEQKSAMQNWITSNAGKSGSQDCIVNPNAEITVSGTDDNSASKTVFISEQKALEAGMSSGDLYSMFGCAKSNPSDTFEKIGSRILYSSIVDYGLNSNDKAQINLASTNPEAKLLGSSSIGFYLTRIQQLDQISQRIKNNWQGNSSLNDLPYIQDSISNIGSVTGNKDYNKSIGSIKDAGRRIAIEVGNLKGKFEEARGSDAGLLNKINATIIDLNTMSRLISEIMEGKQVSSTDTLQIKQIPQYAFGSSGSGNSLNRVAIMLLLSGKVNPKDFFLSLGINKTEGELGLPTNAINYYVQNTEKKGISNKDAFYEAIGQARIEEEFGMPDYYFQGQTYSLKDKPDFENNIDQVLRYNDIDSSSSLYSSTKTYLLDAEKNNPEVYHYYLNNAEVKYNEGIAKFVSDSDNNTNGKAYENSIADVVGNIKTKGLADGIRSPEEDLLFRMGISGNYQSLTKNSPIAWGTANKQAEGIDKKLSLKTGTTKAFITGTSVPASSGRDILSTEDKKIIAGRLGISTTAIDKYFQALNGDINPNDLTKGGQEVFYNSSNPYAPESGQTQSGGVCQSPFTTNGNGVSLAASFVNDTFGYVDKEGIKFAQSQEAARQARDANPDKKIDFLTEISGGLARLTGNDQNRVKDSLLNYLNNDKQTKLFNLTDDKYNNLEDRSGIPTDLLKKLFTRQSSTLVNKPLLAYKRAVGEATAEKAISWKLFSGLGIDLGVTDFGADNLFDIMNGNYQSLYSIGASMIDKALSLPSGTLVNVITAKTTELKNCTLAQAGGSILGKLAGLDFVSTDGNIISNFGQSKIEQVLNLPRGTFGGQSVDELINRVGPINLALSFKIPLVGIITSDITSSIFNASYAKQAENLSDEVKLKQIRNFIDSTGSISSSAESGIAKLKANLISRIHDITGSNKLNSANADVKAFKNQLKYLDTTFNLDSGTTLSMLAGNNITPDHYKDLVANKTVQNMAYLKALDMFGIDGYKSDAAMNLIKNIRTMVDRKQYGDIYSALSSIFNVNLDAKAGFTQGTFENIFNDPQNATKLILVEGIKQVDQQLGLDPSKDASLTGLYSIYKTNLDECSSSLLSDEDEVNAEDSIAAMATGGNADTEQMAEISNTRGNSNIDYNDCKQNARESVSSAIYNDLANRTGRAIVDKISSITNGSINMPIEDIAEFIVNGDMEYYQVAGLSYAANTIINKAGNNELIPEGIRISYDDIKLAIFGDRGAEAAAGNAAISADLNGKGPNDNANINRYGDLCPAGETSLGGLNCLSYDNFIKSITMPRSGSDLVSANVSSTQRVYNSSGDNIADNPTYQARYSSQAEIANSAECTQNPASDSCQSAFQAVNDLNFIRDDARSRSRKTFMEDLEYKSADAMLWKMDKNAFPGLSYALLKGDAQTKEFAMAAYLRNGIMRGELFGIDIGINTARIGKWIDTYNFFSDITSTASLDQFMSGGGYNFVNDFINKNAVNWFGFNLPQDMVGSLIIGMSTGVWDTSRLSAGDPRLIKFDGQTYKGPGNLNIPTVAQIGQNMAESKIFSWADSAFGFDVGTSYKIYEAYRKVNDARTAYVAAKAAGNAVTAAANYDGAKADLVSMVVTMMFSKQIGSAEEKLGLVPGTGSMLVSMMITGFNPVSLAIFIGFNLFGVYKVELLCDADGYYPRIESAPSASVADVTGIGVWNGMSQNTMKQKSMQAAQYKAKRLIGDALIMQESTKFKDIIPSQVMTGRGEDVEFWDSGITKYLCSKLGDISVKGVCGGNTRAGVWENPQTVALTHIGF